MATPQDLGQWQYQPPKEWQKFERICRALWKQIWKDPNTRRVGREGQAQHGVDVYGRIEGKGWGGVQCKKRDAYADETLTVDELRKIVEAAKAFKPTLAVFTVAYTGSSDQRLQEEARLITDQHREVGLFEVHVFSWDDIVECSGDYPVVFTQHFPNSLNVDLVEVNKSLKDLGAAVHSAPERLVELRNEDVRLIAATAAESAADSAVIEEFSSELDHAKELIRQLRHRDALDYLEPLEKRIFARAKSPIRFRLLTNKAAALAGLGMEKEAGELFLQAHQYNTDDEKALCNRAVGHQLLGQRNEAIDFATKAIQKNPMNAGAHAILILCAPPTDSLEQLVGAVPEVLRGSEDVAHALAQVAQGRNDIEQSIRWLELALSKASGRSPGLRAELGSTILRMFMSRGEVLTGLQVRPEERELLERSVALLTDAVSDLTGSGNRKHMAGLLLNRSTAHDLLGKTAEAIADIERALEQTPDDPGIVKQKAYLFHQTGRTDEAIDLLRPLAANPALPDAAMVLSQVLYEQGDRAGAVRVLEESIASGGPSGIRDEQRRFLVHVLLDDDVEKARSLSAAIRSEEPSNILSLVEAAKIERKAGDEGAAAALLEDALRYVSDATPFQHAIALANLLYSLERFTDAWQVYERVVDPRVASPFADRLLYSYYRAGETEKALRACRMRTTGDRRLATQIELSILEDVGDLKGAASITQSYLAKHPGDLELRAKLAGILYRSLRLPELDELLGLKIDPAEATLETGFRLASILGERGQYQRCINLAYELRRRYFDDGEAHIKYVGIFFGRSKQLDPTLQSETVAKDFAVRLKEHDGESHWYIIEDRADATAARNELKTDTDLARRLIGKRINDEIVNVGSVAETRFAVAEIKSKYVYALHESLEMLPQRFAGTTGLERIPIKDESVRETFQRILDVASKRGENASQAQKLYVDLKITIGTLANMIGKEAIEVWDSLTGSKWGIRTCLGNPEEREAAFATLKREGPVVVDITALLTAADLGTLDLLKASFKELLVTQSTVDLILVAIAEKRGPGSEEFMVAYKEGDQYFREEVSQEQIRRYLERLERLKNWVKENCRVVPVTFLSKIEKERRAKLERLIGKSFFETMVAAQENQCPLFSDDFGTRAFAFQEFGVQGLWSQVVVLQGLEAGLISREASEKIAVQLVLRKHKHTTINGSTLFQAAKESEWIGGSPFSSVIDALADPQTDFRSAVVVIADFAVLLWSQPIIDLRREGLFMAALDALAAHKSPDEIVRHLRWLLERRFNLNPLAGKRVLRVLAAWRELKLG